MSHDGAHAVAHVPFRIDEIGCDYYGSSLHKWLFAPIGTGLLYVRKDRIGSLWPLMAARESQADDIRTKSDRVLNDAEHHAALLRSDGEQRVREQAQETLRTARSELQELLRRKHEILHALSAMRGDLDAMESRLDSAALTPDAINDEIINRTLIDLREAQRDALATAAEPIAVPEPEPAPAAPQPPSAEAVPQMPPEHPAAASPPPPATNGEVGHPSGGDAGGRPTSSGTFFSPPEE